jgi:hypothetical protein
MEFNLNDIEDIEAALIEMDFTASGKIEILTEIYNETGREDVLFLLNNIKAYAASTPF